MPDDEKDYDDFYEDDYGNWFECDACGVAVHWDYLYYFPQEKGHYCEECYREEVEKRKKEFLSKNKNKKTK